MVIYLTQKTHQKLCELFEIEHQNIDFEPIECKDTDFKPWNKGVLNTEEYKQKMRETLLKAAPMKGLKHTEETKKKIRDSRKKQIFTKEQNEKRTESLYKKLKTPNGQFNSRKEASKYYNVDPATINYWMKTKPNEYYYLKKD